MLMLAESIHWELIDYVLSTKYSVMELLVELGKEEMGVGNMTKPKHVMGIICSYMNCIYVM